jgi:hypothetical protein
MRRQIIDVSTIRLHPSQERHQRRLKAIRIAEERQKPADSEDPERFEPWRYLGSDPVDST